MYNNHIITVYTEVEDITNVVLILSAHKGEDSNCVPCIILYGHSHLYQLVAQLDLINLSVQVLINQK